MTRNATPHHYLAGGNSTIPLAPNDIVFGLGHWKRYLGHSSVNKKLSQSSAVSYACFLANLKRALLCFSLNKDIFFRLNALHPSLVMYLHRYARNFNSFLVKILGNLPCWIVLFVLRFLDWFSSSIGQQTVVRFLVCLRSTLFSTTCSPNLPFLLKKIAISLTEWPDDHSMAAWALA